MNIYIDESGSFVDAPQIDSWNCVVAYATPEIDTRKIRQYLLKLKCTSEKPSINEIKLKNVSEANYFEFLRDLGTLNGLMFAVATKKTKKTSHPSNGI